MTRHEGTAAVMPWILIVEDDDALRDTLAAIFAFEGHRAVEARNGVEALARVRAHAMPALIILDLMLPVMDGRSFVVELERRGLRQNTRILILSADPEVHAKAARIGADAALEKPFDIRHLLQEIERLTQSAAT